MAVERARRLFTVADYYRMAETGILAEDDRVELIEGEIVEMPPIGDRHASCVGRTTDLFFRLFGNLARVWVQNPVRLSNRSEPVPDLMLLQPRPDFYVSGHPKASDVLLLVEVSDSSEAYDRRVKLPLYAREGVPEVWIVDLGRSVVRVHREPSPTGYALVATHRRGERIAPAAFPDIVIKIEEILGPA
ncbi:MAG: hypothetical protein HW416_3183 [Chloroflexi bacterium]|nr:hypothetical protein [Chloroflexota bacterium]